jgi:hypothetical protein
MLIAESLDASHFPLLLGTKIKHHFLTWVLRSDIHWNYTTLINRRNVPNFQQFQIYALSDIGQVLLFRAQCNLIC